MSETTAPTDRSSPAFVIGISGHMDIPESDETEIEKRLRRIFQWIGDDPKAADAPDPAIPDWWPKIMRRRTGENGTPDPRSERRLRPLPGLGLGSQRIILLTSLAPGADTFAVKAAADFPNIEICAALPFPAGLYRDSSSFSGHSNPEKARETFDDCIASLDRPYAHFPVLLQSDLELTPEARDATFRSDLENTERRHLRYRAAGEYVAAHSHLLVALYTPVGTDDSMAAGTEAIVAVRRTGPTPGILPAANHFPWIDSGPTFHLHARSEKRIAAGNQKLADDSWQNIPARFLPPARLEDEALEKDETGVSAESICRGFISLEESARLMSRFRRASKDVSVPPADAAVEKLIAPPETDSPAFSEGERSFLPRLGSIALAQATASRVANVADRSRKQMMKIMAACAIIAALGFHGFSHWHFAHAPEKTDHSCEDSAAHSGDHSKMESHASHPNRDSEQKWVSFFFLLVTIFAIAFAAFRYRRYRRSNDEWLRFDARAFSEGLRIQFYWAAAGIHASAASLYMHRQKGQLDWIRDAIDSLAFPYQQWSEQFDPLTAEDRESLLSRVISAWIGGQRDFFSKSVRKCRHLLHRFHTLGWGLTWAGVFQAILLLVCVGIHPADGTHDFKLTFPGAVACLSFVAGICIYAFLSRKRTTGKDDPACSNTPKQDTGFLERTLDRILCGGVWPVALVGSAFIGIIVSLVPHSSHLYPDGFWWISGRKDLWIILTGAALVGGAIFIAWSEKLSLAEHARQYEAMDQLFSNAESHARHLLENWRKDPDSTESLTELRLLLVDLGKEALDENAEWLLLHRSRPFEPFLAG